MGTTGPIPGEWRRTEGTARPEGLAAFGIQSANSTQQADPVFPEHLNRADPSATQNHAQPHEPNHSHEQQAVEPSEAPPASDDEADCIPESFVKWTEENWNNPPGKIYEWCKQEKPPPIGYHRPAGGMDPPRGQSCGRGY
eukprot:16433550-Heterocapsa_arctica.AAC.1